MADTSSLPVALITGASRGLGAALAEALAPEHHVVAVGRTIGALEELDDRIKAKGGEATLAPMDITKPEAMQQLCRAIHDRWGKVALWAHTAIHAAPLAPASMINDKDWAKSVEANASATQRLITYIAPLLGQEGTALFFDDPQPGTRFSAAYGASKAAQLAMARSWAEESQRTGPRVLIHTPPPMPTALRARFYPGENREKLTATDEVAAGIITLLNS